MGRVNRAISDSVVRLFVSGRLSADGLMRAVAKGWITQEEADRISSPGRGVDAQQRS